MPHAARSSEERVDALSVVTGSSLAAPHPRLRRTPITGNDCSFEKMKEFTEANPLV